MSDLIKRSDAIKIMACEMYAEAQSQGYEVDSIEDFMPEAKTWMNDAPSADRPQGWIPCSERVPRGSDGISECEMVLMTLSVGYVACGWINGDTAYVLINNPTYDQIVIADSKEVIAWMPLPKPWKGADDE